MKLKLSLNSYDKGKQLITAFVLILSISANILDSYIYNSIYDYRINSFQYFTIACGLGLCFLLLNNIERYYKKVYACFAYLEISNLFITTFLFQPDNSISFSIANLGQRDVYFLLLYVVISAIILGRNHLLIQAGLLNIFLLYYIFWYKESFFISNSLTYLIATNGFLFLIYIFIKTFENFRREMEHMISQESLLKNSAFVRNVRFEEYHKSLLEITRSDLLYKSNPENIYSTLCTNAARYLNTTRVSLWLFDEKGENIVRKYLFDYIESTDENLNIGKKDYPVYFTALLKKPYINAPDAENHPDTLEFKQSYLQPLKIKSLLDCPILIDGQVAGIICCEHKYQIREWQTEDILYIQSISDYIALGFKNQQIKSLLQRISEQNSELLTKNVEIESMNFQLHELNNELKKLNNSLEATVRERTSELETQNLQLSEYAFINSHMLRAPLARIMGLTYLIEKQVKPEDKELIDALILSTQELDNIVKKIADMLHSDNRISREKVKELIERKIYLKEN
ncbi:MAG: GAF domain-containing protein [Cytophagaceae bacterium]